ncbi:MAG TPA: PKD domain-containing protein [Salinivirgaceae bacterium]|nr:PKD domain-containing protein [Salinivirgaceae bacterium]
MYWVKATDFFGRTTSDTINVNFFEPLLPTDIAFCYGSEETVEVNLTGDYSILWSTNETTNSISISEPGTYWVRVTDTLGCFIQKEFNAHADMFSATATLGDDKALCNGNLIVLESGANEAITYLWSDGSSFPWFVVDNHTQVSVTVTNVNGCIAYDTVQINILGDTPNIAFDHTPICKGNSFVFNNLSQTIDGSSIDTCYWIFNQTDTIVGNEATYNSLETGYLPIYLYVTTTAGCYKDTSFYATVNHIPNVSFVPTSACEREDVLFQSTSTVDDGEITEWHWNVNGTQYHTSGFKHSFANAGNYSISLITTSDKGCTDSIVSTFNVKNSPTADFTYEKGCDGEPVAFLNQSTGWLGTSLDYIWHFDSQSQSTQVNPEHLFNGTGNFPVKLIATQQVNHCRDTIVKTVSVSEKPTSLPNDVEVCAKEIVTLTDNSLPGEDENIISKVWKISQPVGNIEESVLYTFDTSGVFSLTLTVENSAGCTDMKQSQLTIYETPKAIISTSLDTVYIPTTATLFAEDSSISHTYRWYIDNILLSNNASISYQINSEGTYDFGLAVETNKGCCDSTNKVLTALIPSVDLEIKSLSAVISDGKILIRPVFRNNGTTPLSQFVINVRFDNGTTFSEIFESTIYSGNEFGYTLRTRMDTPENGTPVYVCLDVVTIQLDQNPDNNYKCFVFDDNTRIFPPSPNPAKDEIKFTVISDNESSCEISIISSGGMLLWEDTLSIVPGVNDITIPTPASAVGINYMKVKINSTQKVFKIMVKQ